MAENTTTSVAVVKDISDAVMGRINDMVGKNELTLPEGYNAGTALRSAMLIIQETKDRNGKTALDVCTKASVTNTLLNMCIQGLQPSKSQCYFIVYGNQLQLFRSYFGTVAALRRAVPSVGRIVTDLAHEGDEVEWAQDDFGERYTARIVTDPITNIEKPIKFGFCNIFGKDGQLMAATWMTWAEIQKSWAQARNSGETQKKFPTEMAKRTLIARACKHLLNSSNESDSVVTAAFNYTTNAEYQREEKPVQRAVRKSLKERYNITPSEDVVDAEAEKVEEPQISGYEDAPGPEDFEGSTFESDSLPNSEEYNEELF